MIALYHLASVKLFVAPCGPEPLAPQGVSVSR